MVAGRLRAESLSVRAHGWRAYSGMLWRRLFTRSQQLFLRRRYVTKRFDGFSMYLDLQDHGISRTLAIAGGREQDQVAIMRRELGDGMAVVDIGSNVGYYPLLASTLVGSSGKVYSAEPSPQNFELLTRNIELNSLSNVIQAFPVGISNETGKATFYLHRQANLHTLNPEKHHDFKTPPRFDELQIDIVAITDFMRGKEPVNLIRMDIEGHEVEVLEGLALAVSEDGASPSVLFENHFPKYDNDEHSMRTQLLRLFELGYYAKTMVSTDESVSRFHEMGYTPERVVKADGVLRGLYEGVSNEDAVKLICEVGYVRATLLSRHAPAAPNAHANGEAADNDASGSPRS